MRRRLRARFRCDGALGLKNGARPAGAWRRRGDTAWLARRSVRIAAAVLALVAVAGLFAWLRGADPAVAAAERLFGERWYAVVFHRTPIGHYRSWSGRDADGHFAFHTALHFNLTSGGETRILDQLTFHRRPPHRLLRATHTVSNGAGRVRAVVIEDGVAQVNTAGQRWESKLRGAAIAGAAPSIDAGRDAARQDAAICAAEDGLTLADYLAVETWLAAGGATPGAQRRACTVDFDRLALVAQHWRVVATGAGGVEITRKSSTGAWPGAGIPPSQDARAAATGVLLDARFAPVRMAVGGPLTLQRVADEAAARLWQREAPLFADARPGAAVSAPIGDAPALKRLVLAVEGDADAGWLDRLDHEGGAGAARLLTVDADRRRPTTRGETAAALPATLSFPAADPELRALAAQAVGDAAGDEARAAALVRFVHGFLRYEDAAGPRSVFDAVRTRRGDCTEFADLYTTLARAVGLPARTVVGLAYRPGKTVGEPGEFALHAWNDVATEGVWRGVDPTWGQTRLDATHLPIQAEDVLAAAVALPRLTFRVVETRY